LRSAAVASNSINVIARSAGGNPVPHPAAAIISAEKFRWLSGTELVSSWKKDTGFRSDFCSRCGSPVPNPLRNIPYVWVPAGLLENGGELEIVAHLCVSSKATWDSISLEGLHHDAAADLAALIATLGGESIG
jgi:hypothetical protein